MKRGLLMKWFVVALLAAAPPAGDLLAQGSTTATVRGTVLDPTGAVLPGAAVVITNTGTKDTRETTTDERGGYLFAGLFPGTYEMKVSLATFKTFERRNITLGPSEARGIDVSLEVGAMTESVLVIAEREIIQTETGAREGVLTAKQIDNLSIIGRSSLELLRILPGVVAPDQNQMESVSFGGGANATNSYTVNGVRGTNNTVSLDGSSLIDVGSNNGVIVTLNNDMVQEVRVQSSNYAAEYGASGMSISAVTKSGTSKFHGSVYDYIRDHRFAANDRSNSIAGIEKPKSTFQYPGLHVGGPLVIPGLGFTKDRLFFFAAYEHQRQKVDSGARFRVVPTPAMKRGDFSELLAGIGQNLNAPRTVNIPGGFPGAGSAAPNNNLGPYIDPLGQFLVNLYPDPNHTDPRNRFNYVYSALEPSNRNDFKARVDYNLSDNTKAYFRLAREAEKNDQPRGLWWGPSEVALPTPNVADNRGQSYSFNLVNVLGQTATVESLVTYSLLELDNYYKDPSRVRKDTNGFPGLEGFFPGASPYVPLEMIHSWGGAHVSDLWSPGQDLFAYNDSLQFASKLTKIKGAHGMKFGASAERVTKRQNFQNQENMQLIFSNWGNGTTGNTLADMLVARPTQVVQGTRIPNGRFEYWNIDVFAQDSWKLRSNLTLEYGLRVGIMPNNAETNDLGAVFDPSRYDPTKGAFLDPGTFQRLNGVRYASRGEVDRGLTENRDPYWLPRVNVAWNIDGESQNVLRGGYGIFVNRPQGNAEYDNALRIAPNAYNTSLSSYDNGLIGGRILDYNSIRFLNALERAASGAISLNSADPNSIHWPVTHSFSVSFARRIPFNQVLETAYVGTRGRNLLQSFQSNFVPLRGIPFSGTIGNANLANPVDRAALDTTIVNRFRPFQAFTDVRLLQYEGESEYNSLQVTLSRQTSRRLQYFATYTLGRTKGTLGGDFGQIDPIDPTRTFGIVDSDRTHIFNLSWNALLPDPIEGGNPVLRGVLNGWQLSGISTVASGVPIRLRFSGDLVGDSMEKAIFGTPSFATGAGTGAFAPVYLRDPRTGDGKVGEKMFDIAALQIPNITAGELGSIIPPFNLRTPTRMNHDITIFKNFPIRGEQRLQFRAGFFNIFNMAYASPGISGDIDLVLETRCNVRVRGNNGIGGTSEVCDPAGGFVFTPNTINNFGKINIKRGHRVVEFALKYYF
jgi:hypothetical protein